MSTSNNRTEYSPFVSSLIDSFVPDHVRANYPDLIAFIAAYLDYLETSNLSGYYQNTLPQQRNIESQDEQFLRRIEQEIGLFVPREYEATPRVFYNKISELWRSKGSTEAVETFFRLFLNDTVQVRFPWDFVLKPSDGRWQAPEKIRVSLISGDPEAFASRRVEQLEEYGFTTVTRVERKVYADQTIYELTILRSDTVGEFKVGNRIATEDRSTIGEIYNSVSNIVIESPGSGYSVGDRIRLEGRSRISFEARVTDVDEIGAIQNVSILDFGSGTTPEHILDSRSSGQYFLNEFGIFQYVGEDRQLDLADNVDISEDSFTGFTQNYTEGIYFSQPYSGTALFSSTDLSLINQALTESDIQVFPSDLVPSPSYQIDTTDGNGAAFSLEFSPIVETSGYYDGVRGQLSEAIVLQDSEFYQKFSYEVVTSYSYDRWIEPLKNHVHPSGTKPFGLINKIERLDPSVEIFSDDVLKALQTDRVSTPENVKISFTKRLEDRASFSETFTTALSIPRRYTDSALTSDSGLVILQSSEEAYSSEYYFSQDYAAEAISF